MKILKKYFEGLEEKIWQKGILEEYEGIRICDVNFDDSDNEIFLHWTKRALDLIKCQSGKLFQRIKRELNYITNQELTSGGRYNRIHKSCDIDFGRFIKNEDKYDWYFHSFVMAIIHEATHAYLESKGIKYTQRNRIRIEKICFQESINFIRKLDYAYKYRLIESSKFNAIAYDSQWNLNKWTSLKIICDRIKESRELAGKAVIVKR